MKKSLFLLCVMLLCAGCTTSVCRHYKVEPESLSRSGRIAVAGIRGQNTGCYLFNCIPVWSGKPHRPNEKKWSMWRNYVRKRDIRKMFAVRAKQLGADDIEDFSVVEKSSGLWSLGIVWTRTISGQCVAVKNLSGKKKQGIPKQNK
ncbi:MAG: hypothetical protein IKA32_01330 [Lentisphaeria bacterium]|nr:hypothetical protein [Lentisphaeria bacterium]